MLKTRNQKFAVIFILIGICVLLISIYEKKSPPPRSNIASELLPLPARPAGGFPEEGELGNEVSNQVIFEIGDQKLSETISGEISVYDFMQKLQAEGKMNFQSKNYPGLGKFITEINGVENGEKYWFYYVNGQKAEIGVSNYKINNGDIVSWKYENFN